MIDTFEKALEIKVSRDPRGGHRVWIHLEGQLVLRLYRATDVVLDIEDPALLVCAEDEPTAPSSAGFRELLNGLAPFRRAAPRRSCRRCVACWGTGAVAGARCTACGGTGDAPQSPE
jgi:hypothetical protein